MIQNRSIPLLIRGAMLAASLGLLTHVVVFATRFAHNANYLSTLGGLDWVFMVSWALVLGLRGRLDPEGTRDWFDNPWTCWPSLAWVLAALLSPFFNAYFTHVTHPTLAFAIAWALWPGAQRVAARVRLPSSPRAEATALSVVAFGVYFVQSYRRHVNFGSGGKDLGLYHQSVWLLSRFQPPDNTILGMNAFGDHMEWIDLLAAPLQWLWADAGALLLFQAVLVASGIYPVVRLAQEVLDWRPAGVLLGLTYLFNAGLHHAVMFDWNPTTCGVALMAWAMWFLHLDRWKETIGALVLLALCKENLVLYAIALGGMMAWPRRDKRLLIATGTLLLLFVVEMTLIFPILREGGFRHSFYEHLGGPMGVLQSPLRSLSVLFTPGAKINGLLLGFSSVAFVCWLAPRFWILFLPMLLERFWADMPNLWWGHHYGAGLAVAGCLAAVYGAKRLAGWEHWRVVVLALPIASLLIAGLGRFGTTDLLLARAPYYTSAEDAADTRSVLSTIPPDAPVAAQNHLIPHLSARQEIYELPGPKGVEYVALNLRQSAWPHRGPYARSLAHRLMAQGYGVIACEGKALVLKRGEQNQPCPALEP